jgi:hypothetical protein
MTKTELELMLVELLLGSSSADYNGHNQAEIPRPSHELALKLCAFLEEYLINKEKITSMCGIRYFSDGSGDISALDYWKPGEHPLGCKDKLLVSWE